MSTDLYNNYQQQMDGNNLQPVPEENQQQYSVSSQNNQNNYDNNNSNGNNNNNDVYLNDQEENQQDLIEENDFQQIFNQDLQNLVEHYDTNLALSRIYQTFKQANESLQNMKFQTFFSQSLKLLNDEAITCLNNDEIQKCDLILKCCENLAFGSEFGEFSSLKALILNNWGCYYRREGDEGRALEAFKQSLKFLQFSKSEEFKGLTFLNLGALLSQQGNHAEALDCSKSAAFYLNKEYLRYLNLEQQQKMENQNNDQYQENIRNNKDFIELVSNLAISLYNVGSEEEIFQRNARALINYQNAVTIAENNLGTENMLTQKFQQFFNEKKIQLQEGILSQRMNLANNQLFQSQNQFSQQQQQFQNQRYQQKSQPLLKNSKQRVNIRKLGDNNFMGSDNKKKAHPRSESMKRFQQNLQKQHPEFEQKLYQYVQKSEQKRQQNLMRQQFPAKYGGNSQKVPLNSLNNKKFSEKNFEKPGQNLSQPNININQNQYKKDPYYLIDAQNALFTPSSQNTLMKNNDKSKGSSLASLHPIKINGNNIKRKSKSTTKDINLYNPNKDYPLLPTLETPQNFDNNQDNDIYNNNNNEQQRFQHFYNSLKDQQQQQYNNNQGYNTFNNQRYNNINNGNNLIQSSLVNSPYSQNNFNSSSKSSSKLSLLRPQTPNLYQGQNRSPKLKEQSRKQTLKQRQEQRYLELLSLKQFRPLSANYNKQYSNDQQIQQPYQPQNFMPDQFQQFGNYQQYVNNNNNINNNQNIQQQQQNKIPFNNSPLDNQQISPQFQQQQQLGQRNNQYQNYSQLSPIESAEELANNNQYNSHKSSQQMQNFQQQKSIQNTPKQSQQQQSENQSQNEKNIIQLQSQEEQSVQERLKSETLETEQNQNNIGNERKVKTTRYMGTGTAPTPYHHSKKQSQDKQESLLFIPEHEGGISQQEYVETQRLFPSNYIVIQSPKQVNLPEFHDRTSLKVGYMFIGFEKNLNVLLLCFSESIEGKSYKNAKEFCQHMVNFSEIMDIWMNDYRKPSLNKTLKHVIQQLLGRIIVNIVDKEIILSEDIQQMEIYTGPDETTTLNFEISGRKNSKIERQKDISLHHLILREQAILENEQPNIIKNMIKDRVDGVDGYMAIYYSHNKVFFQFRVYTPDNNSNKWNKYYYNHIIDMEPINEYFGGIDKSLMFNMIDSFEGLWELEFQSKSLYFQANQFAQLSQEVSTEHKSYHKITHIYIQKVEKSYSNLQIKFRNCRRPSVINIAESMAKQAMQKIMIPAQDYIDNYKPTVEEESDTEDLKKKKNQNNTTSDDEYEEEQRKIEEANQIRIQQEQELQRQYEIQMEKQRQYLEEQEKKENFAANTIQCQFRHKKNQQKRKEKKEKQEKLENHSAVQIQSSFKAKLQRRKYIQTRDQKKKAVETIAKYQKIRRKRKQLRLEFRAAYKIQNMFKKFKKREKIRQLLRASTKDKYIIHFSHSRVIGEQFLLYTVIEFLPKFQKSFKNIDEEEYDNDYENENENGNEEEEPHQFFAQFQTLSQNVPNEKRLNEKLILKEKLAQEISKSDDPWKYFDIYPQEKKVLFRRQVLKSQKGLNNNLVYYTASRDNNKDLYFGQIEGKFNKVIAQVEITPQESQELQEKEFMEKFLIYDSKTKKILYVNQQKQDVTPQIQKIIRGFIIRQRVKNKILIPHIKIFFLNKYYFEEKMYMFFIMRDIKGIYSAKVQNVQRLRLNKKVRMIYQLDKEFALNQKVWGNYKEEFNINIPKKTLKLAKYFPSNKVEAALVIQKFLLAKKIKQDLKAQAKRDCIYDFFFDHPSDQDFNYWIKIYQKQVKNKFAMISYLPIKKSQNFGSIQKGLVNYKKPPKNKLKIIQSPKSTINFKTNTSVNSQIQSSTKKKSQQQQQQFSKTQQPDFKNMSTQQQIKLKNSKKIQAKRPQSAVTKFNQKKSINNSISSLNNKSLPDEANELQLQQIEENQQKQKQQNQRDYQLLDTIDQEQENIRDYFNDKNNRWKKIIQIPVALYDFLKDFQKQGTANKLNFDVFQFFNIDRQQDLFEVKQEQLQQLEDLYQKKQFKQPYQVYLRHQFKVEEEKYMFLITKEPSVKFSQARIISVKQKPKQWEKTTDINYQIESFIINQQKQGLFDPLLLFEINQENDVFQLKNFKLQLDTESGIQSPDQVSKLYESNIQAQINMLQYEEQSIQDEIIKIDEIQVPFCANAVDVFYLKLKNKFLFQNENYSPIEYNIPAQEISNFQSQIGTPLSNTTGEGNGLQFNQQPKNKEDIYNYWKQYIRNQLQFSENQLEQLVVEEKNMQDKHIFILQDPGYETIKQTTSPTYQSMKNSFSSTSSRNKQIPGNNNKQNNNQKKGKLKNLGSLNSSRKSDLQNQNSPLKASQNRVKYPVYAKRSTSNLKSDTEKGMVSPKSSQFNSQNSIRSIDNLENQQQQQQQQQQDIQQKQQENLGDQQQFQVIHEEDPNSHQEKQISQEKEQNQDQNGIQQQNENEVIIPIHLNNQQTSFEQINGEIILQVQQGDQNCENIIKYIVKTNDYEGSFQYKRKNVQIQQIQSDQEKYIYDNLKFDLFKGFIMCNNMHNLENDTIFEQIYENEEQKDQQLQQQKDYNYLTEFQVQQYIIQVKYIEEDDNLIFSFKEQVQPQSSRKSHNDSTGQQEQLQQQNEDFNNILSYTYNLKEEYYTGDRNEKCLKTYIYRNLIKNTFIIDTFNINDKEKQIVVYNVIKEQKANDIKKQFFEEKIIKEMQLTLQKMQKNENNNANNEENYQNNEQLQEIYLDVFLIKKGYIYEIRVVQEGDLVDNFVIGKKNRSLINNFESIIPSYIIIQDGIAQLDDKQELIQEINLQKSNTEI